ncbi:hypothetical protein DMENIID0001_124300 [Sergentomyia squamirostris]
MQNLAFRIQQIYKSTKLPDGLGLSGVRWCSTQMTQNTSQFDVRSSSSSPPGLPFALTDISPGRRDVARQIDLCSGPQTSRYRTLRGRAIMPQRINSSSSSSVLVKKRVERDLLREASYEIHILAESLPWVGNL